MPDGDLVRHQYRMVSAYYKQSNHLMSWGMDGLNRPAFARKVAADGAQRIADLACGAGALSFAMGRAFQKKQRSVEIFGSDFCDELLEIACQQAANQKTPLVRFSFVKASAEDLPYADEQFDVVTMGYGLRFVQSRQQIYTQALRILKPNGAFYLLETLQPKGWMKGLYRCFVGLLLSAMHVLRIQHNGHGHIADASFVFPRADELAKELSAAGFERIGYKKFSRSYMMWAYKGKLDL